MKAVIFDLDGTLVHTAPEYRYKLVGRTLSEFGLSSSSRNIDRFWFEARRDQIIKENFGIEPALFWNIYMKYETIEMRRQFTKLYDDVSFILELKENGLKTGIVTNAPPHIARLEIGMLPTDFDAIIIGQLNGIKPKPHPHGIERCLSLLGIAKEEAVFVGNSDEDIMAAKNARVLDVLLQRGEHEFPEVKPTHTINSLYDLRQFI